MDIFTPKSGKSSQKFGCLLIRKNHMDYYEREEVIRPLLLLSLLKGLIFMLERDFQSKLVQEIKEMFPGCIVTKNDANYIQGIPDWLILYKGKWAALECKKSANAQRQPNQEYYVEQMDKMSFSRFICPENKEEVLHELQQAFES